MATPTLGFTPTADKLYIVSYWRLREGKIGTANVLGQHLEGFFDDMNTHGYSVVKVAEEHTHNLVYHNEELENALAR